MSLPVVLRRAASQDAEEAHDYLESQRDGLGQQFVTRLDEVIDRIGAMAKLYAIVWRNVRAARLRQFPYVVYYRIQSGHVEVLAVMHGGRSASAWKSRAR